MKDKRKKRKLRYSIGYLVGTTDKRNVFSNGRYYQLKLNFIEVLKLLMIHFLVIKSKILLGQIQTYQYDVKKRYQEKTNSVPKPLRKRYEKFIFANLLEYYYENQ